MSSGGENGGKEADDSHVIRLRVDFVKDLGRNGKQAMKIIDGFPWKLFVYRSKASKLVVCIKCDKSKECAIWECEVEGEIKLINQTDNSRVILQGITAALSYEKDSHVTRFSGCDGLIGNYIVDGCLTIEVKVFVKRSNVERNRPVFDFSSPSIFSDLTLVVEGQKLHVSKQILALGSSYFKALFYGNFKESQENEIELKDVSADTFVIALELIHDSVNNINEDNIEDLLRIAHLFDILKVMDEAEKWLIDDNCLPVHMEFRLADQYNLKVAQHIFLKSIESFDEVVQLRESESYKHFSIQLIDKLMGKMVELRAKELKEAE